MLAVAISLVALATTAKVVARFGLTVFGGLRVAVIDLDQSHTSAAFTQAISSAPGVQVTRHSSDLNDAETAVRSRGAIAAVHIPENVERDITSGQQPEITIVLDKKFFGEASATAKSIRQAVSAAWADLEAGPHSRTFSLGQFLSSITWLQIAC
jgi:ABC-2 type transport system permease protein